MATQRDVKRGFSTLMNILHKMDGPDILIDSNAGTITFTGLDATVDNRAIVAIGAEVHNGLDTPMLKIHAALTTEDGAVNPDGVEAETIAEHGAAVGRLLMADCIERHPEHRTRYRIVTGKNREAFGLA